MNKTLKLTTLAAAIALAMGSGAALAATPTPPAATQLPGAGAVAAGSPAPTVGAISGGSQTITLAGNTVIDWGSAAGTINASGAGAQPGGFNIGSAAKLTFGGTGAVLNVDVSGNVSQIMGTLSSTAGNLYVANTNGVIVGAGATINAGAGDVGLISNSQFSYGTTFAGTGANFVYNGAGASGDVDVMKGSTISGATVMVSGGGTVNVDLGGITATTALQLGAGLPSGTTYDVTTNSFKLAGFGAANAGAVLALTGNSTGVANNVVLLASAGDITSSGTVDVDGGGASANGMITNNGVFTGGAAGSMTPGGITNNATMNFTGAWAIGGDFVNNGQLNAPGHVINAKSFTNGGSVSSANNIAVTGGDFTNAGVITLTGNNPGPNINATLYGAAANSVNVTGGNFSNTGKLTAADGVNVLNGSISNAGQLTVGNGMVATSSDSTATGFTKGADYSITNGGAITSGSGVLTVDANYAGNNAPSVTNIGSATGTTGSFTNTGALQLGPSGVNSGALTVNANDDINLGGALQFTNGKSPTGVASNPTSFDGIGLFSNLGNVSVTTPIINGAGPGVPGVFIAGEQVALFANVLSGANSTAGGGIILQAGNAPGAGAADLYAIRVAKGVTVQSGQVGTGGQITIQGFAMGDPRSETTPTGYGSTPNVILNGTFASDYFQFSGSNFFSGPEGRLQVGNDANFFFTGAVKTAPYLNDAANFRYNYLPITNTNATGAAIALLLGPMAFQTNGTTGVQTGGSPSAVNVLVNGPVNLYQGNVQVVAPVAAGGTAVTGVVNTPNTHFVLQSTGDINIVGTTGYDPVTGSFVGPVNPADATNFYWPGYVYLGTIASAADGTAEPGTLGLGQIVLNGNFSNVLPGNTDGASGIHFMTDLPLKFSATTDLVTTNDNAWVNFGTDTLTSAYSSGAFAKGQFFGGSAGSGKVITYGPLAAANFVTQAPNGTK